MTTPHPPQPPRPPSGPPAAAARFRGTVARIDLARLRENLKTLRDLCGPAAVLAVIKADAYGHGALPVARTLEAEGVGLLSVVLVEEALALRAGGIGAEVMVMGGALEGAWDELVAQRLQPALFREEQLAALGEAAQRAGRPVGWHLKVDLGMSRLGVPPREALALARTARRWPWLRLEGLFGHLSCADEPGPQTSAAEVSRYRALLEDLRGEGVWPPLRHLANSAGTLALPEARDGEWINAVRPGLALYGVLPAAWLAGRCEALAPVLGWSTEVIHLKQVPPGTRVSYGGAWTASRESRIATLAVGYADGYPRALSNRAQVLVGGRRAPLVGRVCMDLCMVDVTDVPGVALGDEVVLIGAQGAERITASEVAGWAQTIAYEVLSRIGARVPRVFEGVGPG